MYVVNYAMLATFDAETTAQVAHLNEAENHADLDAVISNCKTYGTDAQLFDEAGFSKGWVRADGSWQLT